jgi:UDP-N-acetylmuramoylalanine--D-glutamate ligase
VVPIDDAVVMAHAPSNRHTVTVGLDAEDGATAFVQDGRLMVEGIDIAAVTDLERSFSHDITNTLVAAALAMHLGATVPGIRTALGTHLLPPHRIQFVTTHDGISFYNDSKATVPHAVITAVRSFDSVVLIAGGRNKGLDLGVLQTMADRTRAVVAMGDAAEEIAAAFEGVAPVHRASGMDEAVGVARSLAQVGDAVLLSPGCTSFDAYANYGARGDDFIRAVRELVEVA